MDCDNVIDHQAEMASFKHVKWQTLFAVDHEKVCAPSVDADG